MHALVRRKKSHTEHTEPQCKNSLHSITHTDSTCSWNTPSGLCVRALLNYHTLKFMDERKCVRYGFKWIVEGSEQKELRLFAETTTVKALVSALKCRESSFELENCKNQLNDEITQWHTVEWAEQEREREGEKRAKTKRLQHHACYFLLDTHYCISPWYYRAAMPRPNAVANKRQRSQCWAYKTTEPILLWLCNDSNRWKSKSNVAAVERTKAHYTSKTFVCMMSFSIFHLFCFISHYLYLCERFVVALALSPDACQLSKHCILQKTKSLLTSHLIPFSFVLSGTHRLSHHLSN